MALGQTTADSVANSVAAIVGKAAGQTATPAEALRDLRLPPKLQDLLKPYLDQMGLSYQDAEARVQYNNARRYLYTQIKGGAVSRNMFHIPSWLLSPYNDQNWEALASLAFAFRDTTVCIFSEGMDVPESRINELLLGADGWASRNIKAKFIAWGHVQGLPSMNEDDINYFIKNRLELEAQSGPAGPLELKGDQRSRLEAALVEAFPADGDLEKMVRDALHVNPAEIFSYPNTRPKHVYDLLIWATAQDRLAELVKGAQEANSSNLKLRAMKQELLG